MRLTALTLESVTESATVAAQLAAAAVPARMVHEAKFWGMRTAAPRHDPRPRLTDGKPGQAA